MRRALASTSTRALLAGAGAAVACARALDRDDGARTSTSDATRDWGGASTLAHLSEDYYARARRFGVASAHFAPMYVVDYRAHRARVRAMGANATEDDVRASRQILWTRVAERFRDCARSLGGIYVKAGQHVCAQPIAPRPFQIVLRELMDDASRRPFEEDRRTFKEETGMDIEEAFAEFDETPFASASMAQVYRAKTLAGEDVAVKIQQRPVAKFLRSDLATIEGYYSLMERLVPGLRFRWLADETRRHMNEEMDFTAEAANALKAQKMLANEFDESELKIPRVHGQLSGKRVLTMEWCDGSRIDDREALERMGIDVPAVAARIQKIFARMTFVHGFVHADPHPGNILVDSSGKIILLDHGVYRSLDDDLRAKWARLWLALMRSDDKALRDATSDLGMDPEMSQFFKLILVVIPARVAEEPLAKRALSADSLTIAEKRAVMKQIMGVKLEDQTRLFETLPRDLLLVLKANNLLRYVNEQLGSPVNRYSVIWKAANEGLANAQAKRALSTSGEIPKPGLLARARARLSDAVAISVLPLQLFFLKGQLAFTIWKVGKAGLGAKAAPVLVHGSQAKASNAAKT
ncbi:Protein kinase-like domain [Ostreococcus tauri]|uniref:Protein kinase-like domain n=1 Tax=Ostreococcus tauri TaxID=70448 RepID=Q00X43_OSTTA|nr:Protein kinase-like domain [Ostreococcus tauri]CAL56468.1 Protein kinase-like domain [Ostreococcus tauri]|eukprot:XP_003082611.1 Protein kinase-like domain [Ostreococcus tauri]